MIYVIVLFGLALIGGGMVLVSLFQRRRARRFQRWNNNRPKIDLTGGATDTDPRG